MLCKLQSVAKEIMTNFKAFLRSKFFLLLSCSRQKTCSHILCFTHPTPLFPLRTINFRFLRLLCCLMLIVIIPLSFMFLAVCSDDWRVLILTLTLRGHFSSPVHVCIDYRNNKRGYKRQSAPAREHSYCMLFSFVLVSFYTLVKYAWEFSSMSADLSDVFWKDVMLVVPAYTHW